MNNDAKYLAYLKGKMSVSEYRTYLRTEDGLRRKCQLHNYDPILCAPELEALHQLIEEKNQRVWDETLSACHGDLEYAIQSMLCRGYPPPHWRHTCECDNCGIVIVEEQTPLSRSECPWCDTWYANSEEVGCEAI